MGHVQHSFCWTLLREETVTWGQKQEACQALHGLTTGTFQGRGGDGDGASRLEAGLAARTNAVQATDTSGAFRVG
ncbi:hypothetical protein A6I77_01710 [Achromobacter xylosoxidans]|jgi:hypothetical protein|nr:hypothetical protein A6I77_01710 [Achromobacter xylosoxidans]